MMDTRGRIKSLKFQRSELKGECCVTKSINQSISIVFQDRRVKPEMKGRFERGNQRRLINKRESRWIEVRKKQT